MGGSGGSTSPQMIGGSGSASACGGADHDDESRPLEMMHGGGASGLGLLGGKTLEGSMMMMMPSGPPREISSEQI